MEEYSHASLRIRELLMVAHQMLLVPRVFFHPLVVLQVPEQHLTEAVEIGDVGHLRIEKLAHQGTGRACVVYLAFPIRSAHIH